MGPAKQDLLGLCAGGVGGRDVTYDIIYNYGVRSLPIQFSSKKQVGIEQGLGGEIKFLRFFPSHHITTF